MYGELKDMAINVLRWQPERQLMPQLRDELNTHEYTNCPTTELTCLASVGSILIILNLPLTWPQGTGIFTSQGTGIFTLNSGSIFLSIPISK